MSFGSEFAAGFASGMKITMDAAERAANRELREREFAWRQKVTDENQRISRSVHHVLSPEEEAEERRLKKALPGASTADPGTTGATSGTGGKFAGNVEKIIREEAVALGVDPEIAVRVAKSEGGLKDPTQQSYYVNPKTGKRETSYGPFQLLIGGGLGDKALAQGIDPRKPENLRAGVRFALTEARRTGWGPWYGAAKAGIGRWAGLRGPIPSSAGSKIAGAATTPAAAPTAATPAARPAYIAPGDTTSTQAGKGDLDAIIANPTSSPDMVAWAKREKARLYGEEQASLQQSDVDFEPVEPEPSALDDEETAYAAQGGAIPRRYEPGGRVSGNIDVAREQPRVPFQGRTATVNSMSFNEDGREVLIPRVSREQNRVLDPKEAVDEYHRTGRHLGQFPTPDEADEYAEGLHQREEERIMKSAIPPRQKRRYAPGGSVDYYAMGQAGNPFSMGMSGAGSTTGYRPRKIGEDPLDFGPKAPPPPAIQTTQKAKPKAPAGTPLMQGPGKGEFSWSGQSKFDQIPTVQGWGKNSLKGLTDAQLQSFVQRGATVPNDPRGMFAEGFGPASWAFGVGTQMTPQQKQQMQDYARYRLGEHGVANAYSAADLERAQSATYQAMRQPQGDRSGAQYSGRAAGGPITPNMRAGGAIPKRGSVRAKVEHYATGGAKKQKAVEKDTGLVAAEWDPDDYEAPTLQPRMHLEGRAYGGPYAIPRQEDIGWGVDMVTPAQARSRERRAELAAFRAADTGEGDPTTLAGTDPMMGMMLTGMGGMGGGGGMGVGQQMPGFTGVTPGQPAPGAGSPTGYRRFAAGGPADPIYGTNTGVMQPGDPRVGVPGYYNEPQDPWRPNKVGDVPQEYGPHPPPFPPVTKDKPKPAPSAGLEYMGEHAAGPSATGGAYGLPASSYGGPVYKNKSGQLFSDEAGKYAIPASAGLKYADGGGVVPQGQFGGGVGGGTASRMDWRNYWDQPPEYYRAGPGGSEAQHGEVEQLNARRRGPAPGGSTPSKVAPAPARAPAEGVPGASPGDPGLRRPYDTPQGIPEGPQVGQNLPEERADKKLPVASTEAPVVTPPVVPDAPKSALATPEGSGRIPERNTPLKTETAIPPRTTPKKSKRKSKSAFEATVEDGSVPEEKIETPGIKTQPATYAEPDEAGIYDPRTSGKPLPPLKAGQSWQDLGDGTFKLDVGSTGALGETRGITVGGPQLTLLQAGEDNAPVDPEDPSGWFQMRKATGLRAGGAIPSRYADGGGVDTGAAAARQRLLQRASAVGLTEGDINRAQSDPSRYGPYFFEGADQRAPRGKPVTETKPSRTAQPAKPTKRAPTATTRPGIPEGPQVGQEPFEDQRGQRYVEKPRVDLQPVPPEAPLQPVPLQTSDDVPQAPRSYVQPSPLPPSTMPVPASATQNIPYAPQGPETPQAIPPRALQPTPPVPRDENLPPPAVVNDPRRRDLDPIGIPRPGRPTPPRVDPQRTERPPRQVRQIDTRVAPAMGWVYVLGPDGQPTQVPANAAHLYRPLPPPGVEDQLPARPRTPHAGVKGGQPRQAPVLAPQPFPERRPMRPPVPAVAQGGMIPHYALGGYYPPEGPGGAEAQHGEIEAMPPPTAIPSRGAAAVGPFTQPAPAAPPAAGAPQAQAPQEVERPKAPREEQDAIVNPNREVNPALPSFVNGLQWFQKQLRDLMDGSHDPRAQLALQQIAQGQSGGPVEVMSREEVKQVEAAVDPEGKLDPGQRNIKAYQDIYDFYLAHDQPEKAAATAMALTLYNKRFTQSAGAMALAALKDNNVQAAAQWLDKAFDAVPDYKDLEYQINPDGNVSFKVINRLENRVEREGIAGPQELAALAMQFQTGGLFDKQMGANMAEVAAWRGRRMPQAAEKPPNEAALKRADNREVTIAYDAGVLAGSKGDEKGIMEAARKVYDHMGHTPEAVKVIDRMFRDANMEPPASIQAERDAHPTKDPNDPATLKERDRVAQAKKKEELIGAIGATRDDPAKNQEAYRSYADQSYQWQPENRPPPPTEMLAAMPEDIKPEDPRYNSIKTGAFLILKRNDIDPGYATQFVKTLLDPTRQYRVTQDGNVEIQGLTYPLFVPSKVLTDAERYRQGAQKKAA